MLHVTKFGGKCIQIAKKDIYLYCITLSTAFRSFVFHEKLVSDYYHSHVIAMHGYERMSKREKMADRGLAVQQR